MLLPSKASGWPEHGHQHLVERHARAGSWRRCATACRRDLTFIRRPVQGRQTGLRRHGDRAARRGQRASGAGARRGPGGTGAGVGAGGRLGNGGAGAARRRVAGAGAEPPSADRTAWCIRAPAALAPRRCQDHVDEGFCTGAIAGHRAGRPAIGAALQFHVGGRQHGVVVDTGGANASGGRMPHAQACRLGRDAGDIDLGPQRSRPAPTARKAEAERPARPHRTQQPAETAWATPVAFATPGVQFFDVCVSSRRSQLHDPAAGSAASHLSSRLPAQDISTSGAKFAGNAITSRGYENKLMHWLIFAEPCAANGLA